MSLQCHKTSILRQRFRIDIIIIIIIIIIIVIIIIIIIIVVVSFIHKNN